MTTPAGGAVPSMTPERWRTVDAILKGALARGPAERDSFIAHACAGDAELRREITSLLAAHDTTDDEFLERPAAEALGTLIAGPTLLARLTKALEGRYAIEGELAQGGMATVFLARDVRHDRRVAIKVLREELAAAVGAERFLAEIRVTASLQHPHILPLFDSGSEDGLLWYVMPFVEGETLRTRLTREGRLAVDEAVRIVFEMADALDHAHRHGVVHRDVKPENVLLQDGHALVADFGVALALEHAGGDRLTRTGIRIGTPQYMAPEQAAGEREIDARVDVYALGAVLREMLAGESRHPALSLAERRSDVPPFVDAAVRRALAKLPDDRFPSAAAFAAAVTVPTSGSERQAKSPGHGAPDERGAERRGRMVSARSAFYAALVTLVLGLAGGVALGGSSLMDRWTGRAVVPVSPPRETASEQWPSPSADITLALMDRAGKSQRVIPANRPWTPRFSPDGRRVAYGAFGDGRSTSDLWVTDLDRWTTRRLTDDDADSNDPQWSPDGARIAYSARAPGGKDILVQPAEGGDVRVLAKRFGTQFASDWLPDGSGLLVTDDFGRNARDVIVQPVDGSAAREYAATRALETAARISPNGQWIAYTSDETGRAEVYVDSYPRPGRRMKVSAGGGIHPVWRGDGRELYYWENDALMAVPIGASVGRPNQLFRAAYQSGENTMYDVSPDGQQFVIVQRGQD